MNNATAAPARVLVVDDLEPNRDLLARRVRRLGYEAVEAPDGRRALAELRRCPCDVVLLDITMPEMDGYETLRQMRADPALAAVPVIMVSAIDETDSVVRCLELGADDYLPKPFNPLVLRARLESSLARKRLADQQRATLQALARELEIGQRIQRGFLPELLPAVAGWQLAACCLPARQVGGDFYDAFQLTDGRLAVLIADVCDKGVGAALYMALFRSLLRASLLQAPTGDAAERVLGRAASFTNDYIVREHGRDNMFATVFVGLIEPDSGVLHYLNAGHDPPLLIHGIGGRTDRIEPGGPALGMVAAAQHPVGRVALERGDRLIGYTDGVTEAHDAHGRTFGEAAFIAAAAGGASGDAQADMQALRACVQAHTGGRPLLDDLTLLIVHREG